VGEVPRMVENADYMSNLAMLFTLAGGILPQGFEEISSFIGAVIGSDLGNFQGLGLGAYEDDDLRDDFDYAQGFQNADNVFVPEEDDDQNVFDPGEEHGAGLDINERGFGEDDIEDQGIGDDGFFTGDGDEVGGFNVPEPDDVGECCDIGHSIEMLGNIIGGLLEKNDDEQD